VVLSSHLDKIKRLLSSQQFGSEAAYIFIGEIFPEGEIKISKFKIEVCFLRVSITRKK
jgi:hypothetical protein